MDSLEKAIKYPGTEEAIRTHDQIVINLFVFLAEVKVTYITLPPYHMESTWAGDYTDQNYTHYWADKSKIPYLIHWAGLKTATDQPIDQLFTGFLTSSEKDELNIQLARFRKSRQYSGMKHYINRVKTLIKRFNK